MELERTEEAIDQKKGLKKMSSQVEFEKALKVKIVWPPQIKFEQTNLSPEGTFFIIVLGPWSSPDVVFLRNICDWLFAYNPKSLIVSIFDGHDRVPLDLIPEGSNFKLTPMFGMWINGKFIESSSGSAGFRRLIDRLSYQIGGEEILWNNFDRATGRLPIPPAQEGFLRAFVRRCKKILGIGK